MASPDKKAYLLRLPHDVWAQIERLAAAELRSVNGQIEYLLRESLGRRTGTGDPRVPQGEESSDRAASGRKGGQKNKR